MKTFWKLICLAAVVGLYAGCSSSEVPVDSGLDAVVDVADDTVDPVDAADFGGPDNQVDSVGDVGSDIEPDVVVDVPDPDVPFCPECVEEAPVPLESFRSRQAEYLAFCAEANGPGQGNTYGQICRVKSGLEVNTDAIASGIADLTARIDCSDFRASSLVRILYLNLETEALDEATRISIEDALINYKYWMTEPGKDKMCYWSENHEILFHSCEYLAGQMFYNTVFPNANMTGAEHIDHAKPLILKWLDLKGTVGFSEWHSNVYFAEDIAALVNLIDFADDPEISTKAAMVMDIIAYDMAMNYYDGFFATTHGRTYEGELVGGLDDHTAEAGWVLFGLGEYEATGSLSGTAVASSTRYFTPDIIETLAVLTASGEFEHRQRDSIDIADGAKWGLTYDSDEDIPLWANMAAIASPEIVNGMLAFVDKYDLWDGFLFGDLPDYLIDLLKANMGTQDIVNLSSDAEAVSKGIALQAINTYTYRTDHYQISAAQDYHPGYFGSQTLMWQATLDEFAVVITSAPTDVDLGGDDVSVAGNWVGSWMPRATVYRNAAVIQYRVSDLPDILTGLFIPRNNHAYFPQSAFDEVRKEGNWVIGKKGDGYVALYSQAATTWSLENDYELMTDVKDNTWLVQLGSVDEFESFDAFVAGVTGSAIAFAEDGAVTWDSPSVGEIKVGWTGPFTVAGNQIDLGPYDRFDNASSSVKYGSRVTRITAPGTTEKTLELDFVNVSRKVLVHPAP